MENLNEDELRFHDFTAMTGGITRPLYLHLEDSKKLMDMLLRVYPRALASYVVPGKSIPKIIVDYVDNPILNAFADKDKDCYIIGINEGIALLTFDLFNRIFSQPSLYRDIGNPDLEVDNSLRIENYYTNSNHIKDSEIAIDMIPKCMVRRICLQLRTLIIALCFRA